jgi:leucyl-tRNA synthetase
VLKGGTAMSKSKGNIVDPDEMVEKYGADTCRLFVLFAAPPERDMEFMESGVEGQFRFLSRLYRFITRNLDSAGGSGSADRQALRKLHQTLKKVTEDFESRWHFNTSIAALMELLNEMTGLEAEISRGALDEILEKTVLMLGPFAPYTAEELWTQMGRTGPVFRQTWPAYDPELAREDEAEVVVQVNGKLRDRLFVPHGTAADELERRALALDKVQAFVNGKQVVKVITVPGKLVNIVVK